MEKLDALNQVAEFHRTFKAPILESPQIPDQKRCDLRISLLQEELNELKSAIDNFNIIEVADALADIQYVLSGAVLEFGLGDKFIDLFDEVQRSNMTKACLTMEDAEKTVEYYKQSGTEAHIEESEGKFIVFRTLDHKVLKSISYSPAILGEIIYNSKNTKGDTISEKTQNYTENIKWDDKTGTIEVKQVVAPKGGGLGNVY